MTALIITSRHPTRSGQNGPHGPYATSHCCAWVGRGADFGSCRGLGSGSYHFRSSTRSNVLRSVYPVSLRAGSGLALGTLFTQIKEVYAGYLFPPEYLSLRGHTLYCIWSLSSKINQLAEESGVFPTGQYASRVNG